MNLNAFELEYSLSFYFLGHAKRNLLTKFSLANFNVQHLQQGSACQPIG